MRFMKRLIIYLAVAVATFSIGAATRLRLNLNHIFASRPSVASSPVPGPSEVAAQSVESKSLLELTCDYDPKEFNPRGVYYILGRKPKHFREFDCFELAVDHETARGVAVLETYSNRTGNSHYILSGSLTRQHLNIVAFATSDQNFDYRFDGHFLRSGVLSDAGRNEAVLRGTLVKSKQGVKIAECEVMFRIEYLGC
jgi:hypothetical protein